MLKRILSLFDRKSSLLSAPGDELLALFRAGAPTSTGMAIGVEAALRNTAVNCAIRVVSEPIAQLPLIVYRRKDDGTKERATDHPAYALLHDDANGWQSAFDLKLQIQVDALLEGNGYAFVNRVGGRVRELIRLCPADVTIETSDVGPPHYFLGSENGRREIPITDLIHIRGLSTDGARGRSAVRLAAEAIAIATSLEHHVGQLLGQGARPSGVLQVKGKYSEQAHARLSNSFLSSNSGSRAGGTPVLEEGMEFKPLTFNSVDLQFLEIRKFQIEEIARAFRVPPHLLMEMGRATWSNTEQLGRQFVLYTLMPWLDQWQGAIRRAMFTAEERKTYFAEFLVDDLQRADVAARSEAYQKMIASRVYNPNEVRAMENLPPYSGGDEFINPNVQTARI